MARIYTLVNQKGGVGKTTTAINLGAYLAIYGQKVLLVDIDPQANATSCLGIDKYQVKSGTYQCLVGQISPSTAILFNQKLKISLLPSSSALAGAEIELVGLEKREKRLTQLIQSIQDRYDYILVDCPPSLGLLTLNGLIAARNGLIIPVQCEYLSLEGLGQLTQTIRKVQASLFPELTIRGVVMTMFDSRTKLSSDVVSEVKRVFPNKVFGSIIPRSVRLAEAPSYGLPISAYAPDSSSARAYSSLVLELLQQDGIQPVLSAIPNQDGG
ncbi:MAG: sporulation initiation inhibitor Soj [Anaerolinea sp.]|nr:sporulation initiation inhibitor Soj [Anaerolinea sp.]